MGNSATQERSGIRAVGRRGVGRSRFPQEAADIMLRYYHNVSTFPEETERIELARKVKSVAPRCSHYTAHHVYQYFANLRHRARNGLEPSLPSDALDASQREESPRKPERLGCQTAAQNATSHAVHMPIQLAVASVAIENAEDPRGLLTSTAHPHRAAELQAGEMESQNAEDDKHSPCRVENPPQRNVPKPPSPDTTPSEPSLKGRGNAPESELPTNSALATRLRFALAQHPATTARHRLRLSEPPPKSFAELATWLAERRPTLESLVDSALVVHA